MPCPLAIDHRIVLINIPFVNVLTFLYKSLFRGVHHISVKQMVGTVIYICDHLWVDIKCARM